MGEKTKYWNGINQVTGLGPIRFRKLIDFFGDVEHAWHAEPEQLLSAGLGRKVVEEFLRVRSSINLDFELGRILDRGFKVITWDSDGYPVRLKEIEAPPPVLYVWGEFIPADRWSVAIVGTRRLSPYGETVASEIATVLAANGVTVISGMARGIDGIAHRGALAAGGRTIAVLGSGFDHIYPPEHRNLAQEISKRGAVITDYSLGTAPEARNFPVRNRLISGLSLVVVIVEAGETSGALITAHFAAEQGRDVFAVPGSIHSKVSKGANRLIQSGAQILLSPEDVLEALNLDVIARQETMTEFLPEDDIEKVIFDKLSREPIHVDEIKAQTSLPVAKIAASLAMLELKGRARQVGGMHYVRVREPSAEYRVE
ncbi:MAG: DNA-protecting protein DprA [Anaerolineales bacterium]|nr:DNA-protecting protein DprA [Anaerolineales bacterium]